MSIKLHNAFLADAEKVRTALGEANVPRFNLTIDIDGRTLSDADECRIEYTVGVGNYGESVKGDTVEACLAELLRRKGWTTQHAPLRLAAPRKKATALSWDSVES